MNQLLDPRINTTPNTVSHQLYRLVKSLNKAEKRAFRLYAKRGRASDESLHLRLFDVLDRQRAPDDEATRSRLTLTPQRYGNLKRHLYRELLVSTRLLAAKRDIDCELREQLDFAHVLYGKGLPLDALRLLGRAKTRAAEHNRDLLHLEFLEFEKRIEARHVTHSRSVGDYLERLVGDSAERSYRVLAAAELANVNLQIHGRYIARGHSRTADQRAETARFWKRIRESPLDYDRDARAATFSQQFHRLQSSMWYHYIQLDLARAEDRARGAATLFQLDTKMKVLDPDRYTRSLYYVSVMTYLRGDTAAAGRYAQRLWRFRDEQRAHLNANSRIFAGVYAYLAGFNDAFGRGDFAGAGELADRLRVELAGSRLRPSPPRVALLRYRMAAADFALGRYGEAVDELNAVLNARHVKLRDDLLINTRLLHALCHEALGHDALLEYDLTNIGRFLRKSPETAGVHGATLTALRQRLGADEATRRAAMVELARRVDALRGDPFEAKAMRYLDPGVYIRRALGG